MEVDGGMRSRRGEANPGGHFKSRAPAFARRLWSPLNRETNSEDRRWTRSRCFQGNVLRKLEGAEESGEGVKKLFQRNTVYIVLRSVAVFSQLKEQKKNEKAKS